MKTVILNGQEIKIGTKLRFIDDRNLYTDNRDIIKIPELGEIYTVRGFNDIGGMLLQLRADSSTNGMVDLSNFTYINQSRI